MRLTWRRTAALAVAVVAVGLAATPVLRAVDGLALLARAADLGGAGGRLAGLLAGDSVEWMAVVPGGGEPMRARVYSPTVTPRQTVLLVTGVHPAGIDEPRLIKLSRELARSGVRVVTPEIPELRRFEITPVITDRIEQAAGWLSGTSGLADGRRIGLMGVSFSGGLAVVAAGRPSLDGRVRFVFSFGGHDDLRRVLEYLCASSGTAPPHDYGAALVLLNVAERLAPADQVAPLRAAVLRFLNASYIDRSDAAAASSEFQALRSLAASLPEPSATLLRYLNDRDVVRLGPLLRPHIDVQAEHPALSPALSPAPSSPVFLLHGRADTVIPPDESRRLAERLRGHTPVRLLITDLVTHAEAEGPPHLMDVLRLAVFWGDLLAE